MWLSIDLRFMWFWLSIDSRFKCGCELICDSNDFGCQLIWDSSDLDVKWFEIQVIWLSTDVWCKWFWLSIALRLNWLSIALRFNCCQMIWDSIEMVVNWFGIQASPRFPFLQDFLQKQSCKLKNETFLRHFLQKRCFDAQKRSFSARLPSKIGVWSSKTKLSCETSFKNDMLTRHLTSEFQYVLTIFRWMLQKYCACHEKVEPRQTNSCNCHAHCKVTFPWREICNPSTDSASEASKIDVTKPEILARTTRKASFHALFKSTTPANVFATLRNSCACQVFCNASKSLRLPRKTQFEPSKTSRAPGALTILTSKSPSRHSVVQILRSSTPKALRACQFLTILTSKSLLRHSVVQILRSWASKSAPNPRCFNDFDFQIALARRRGANFVDIFGSRSSATPVFRNWLCENF